MGTVHLTQGHHRLFCSEKQDDLSQRILLTEAMVDVPVKNMRGDSAPVRESRAQMVRAALRGLQALQRFDAAISIHYVDDEGEPYLLIPHRTWGEISLNEPDNLIVTFSHDSRKDNAPFKSLYQWLEEYVPEGEMLDDVFFAFEAEWHDPEKWHQFFRKRISWEVDALQRMAVGLREKAKRHDSRAGVIATALR